MVSLIGLVGIFLLIPPAMDLLLDGAASRPTAPGWYARSLRSHWWKPFTSSAITQGIIFTLCVPLVIALYIVLVAVMIPIMANVSDTLPAAPTQAALSAVMSSILPPVFLIGMVGVLIGSFLMLVVQAVLGLLLPALCDRGFGGAFRLIFSRKGLRNMPRLFGGILLFGTLPTLLYSALMMIFGFLNAPGGEPFGLMLSLYDFERSWISFLLMLVVQACTIVVYAFRFCVYQQIKEEEEAERQAAVELPQL
jgi:hypothetical protein